MPDESKIPYIKVEVLGSEISGGVRNVTVEDCDRLIDCAVIEIDDASGSLRHFAAEGFPVKITMGWDTEYCVLFEGITVQVPGKYSFSQSRIQLIAFDLSYRMMLGEPKRLNHPPGPLSTVLRTIVEAYKLEIGQIEIDEDPEFTEENPLRQSNEKDWLFIQRLAKEYSARAFVEYNEESSKFYFISETRLLEGDPLGMIDLKKGAGIIGNFTYRRIASMGSPRQAAVTVDPVSGEIIATQPDESPPPDETPGPDSAHRKDLAVDNENQAAYYDVAGEIAAEAAETPDTQRPRHLFTGIPSDPVLAARKGTRRDPTRIMGHLCKGKVPGTIWLRAKGKVQFTGAAPWIDNYEWYVRKTVHTYTADGESRLYETSFEVTR